MIHQVILNTEGNSNNKGDFIPLQQNRCIGWCCSIAMSVCCGLGSALLYASKDLRPVKSLILVDMMQVDRTAPEMKVLPR